MTRQTGLLIVVLVVAAILVGQALYVIREDKQVIITQFGRPVGDPVTAPGLHIKLPFIQKVNEFENRWLAWDGDANQMPTLDKRFIWVDTFARWRISDPLLFFQRVRDERGAQTRLDDILDGETRKAVANVKLIEVVRSTEREFAVSADLIAGGEMKEQETITTGREAIVGEILKSASAKTSEFGIELVDVRFKRLN
jgi:membrane protease subunit HflC